MIKVFIGGSRKISKLNNNIKKRIYNIIDQGYLILIGDADGADKAVQKFLCENKYKKVIVFCSGIRIRNNLGHWKEMKIKTSIITKSREFYMIKDSIMASKADYGFMLWDGKSVGTINNVINLVAHNKKTLLYHTPTRLFYSLSLIEELKFLLDKYSIDIIDDLNKKINYSDRIKELSYRQYKLI